MSCAIAPVLRSILFPSYSSESQPYSSIVLSPSTWAAVFTQADEDFWCDRTKSFEEKVNRLHARCVMLGLLRPSERTSGENSFHPAPLSAPSQFLAPFSHELSLLPLASW